LLLGVCCGCTSLSLPGQGDSCEGGGDVGFNQKTILMFNENDYNPDNNWLGVRFAAQVKFR